MTSKSIASYGKGLGIVSRTYIIGTEISRGKIWRGSMKKSKVRWLDILFKRR